MARSYKRDSHGRFAGGGGGSSGGPKSSGGKRSAPKTTSARGRALQNQRRSAALVSASRGGAGPSAKAVRSVLTAQRARAFYAATGGGKKRSAVKPATKKTAKATAAAVRARTKAGSGVKAAEARARSSGRPKARGVAGPVNTSGPAFSRRMARAETAAVSQRRMQAEMARPLQFSGRKPGGPADTRFREQLGTASYNRQNRSQAIAREAKKVLALAAQSPSDWKSRPRFSTVRNPSKTNVAWSYSDLSAWGSSKRRARRK